MARTVAYFDDNDVLIGIARKIEGEDLWAVNQHEHDVTAEVVWAEVIGDGVLAVGLDTGQKFELRIQEV